MIEKNKAGCNSKDPDNDKHNWPEYSHNEDGDQVISCKCGVDFFGYSHRQACYSCYYLTHQLKERIVSESKYILVYPFESREKAFELANDIDGSLMWQNGTAYPIDNIPAFIIPVTEFSERWTAPRQIQSLKAKLKEAEEIIKAVAHICIDWGYGEYELEQKHIDAARKLYEEKEAQHKEGGE